MSEEVTEGNVAQGTDVNAEGSQETKSREDVRAERDFLKYKHESRELKSQNEKLLEEIEALKEQSLIEKSNYKELYEGEKQKTEKLIADNKSMQSSFFGSLRDNEIQKEAVKLGIRDEALQDLKMLDKDSVITETTSTGSVNILGATEFVEKLKQSRPYWFKQQGAPTINNGTPEYNKPKELTASDLLKLQSTDPEKYRKEILRRSQNR